MKLKFIVISGVCCNGTCRRVPVVAKRFSDGWISLCDQCQGKTVQLDKHSLDKIIAAQKAIAQPQRRTA